MNKWEELATGNSGNIELERAWLRAAKDIYEIFCIKQTSYGPNNIAEFGEAGVVIRSNDKLKRLKNLIVEKVPNPLEDESVEDTWMDWADYGIIGLLCHRGEWPEEDTKELVAITTDEYNMLLDKVTVLNALDAAGKKLVTITAEGYNKLVTRNNFLADLEAAGVDNWSGYSHACDIMGENDD